MSPYGEASGAVLPYVLVGSPAELEDARRRYTFLEPPLDALFVTTPLRPGNLHTAVSRVIDAWAQSEYGLWDPPDPDLSVGMRNRGSDWSRQGLTTIH